MSKKHSPDYSDRIAADPQIQVDKLGAGLTDNVPVEPIDLKIGDRVYIAVEGVVVKDGFAAVKRKEAGTSEVAIVYVIDATGAAFVDRDLVAGALDEQSKRNAEAALAAKKAAEAAKGIMPLYDAGPDGSEAKPAKKAATKRAAPKKAATTSKGAK